MDIISKVLEFLSEHGIVSIPLITFAFIVVFLILKDKVNKFVGGKVSVKVITKSSKDLLAHTMFIKEPKYKFLVMNSMFGDEHKNEIFRNILLMKIDSTLNHTKIFISEYDIENIGVRQLECFLYENTRRIVENYNNDIKKFLMNRYGSKTGGEVHEYVMNSSPSGFNTIHDSQIMSIDQLVGVMCVEDSAVFKNNVDRVEVYLHLLNSSLHVGLVDAENMFRDFNGTLSKIIDG